MTPNAWTLVGVLGAALLGAAAALLTAGPQRRKIGADADSEIVTAANQVVELLRGELDAMAKRLRAETERCDALARRVEHLERLLAATAH